MKKLPGVQRAFFLAEGDLGNLHIGTNLQPGQVEEVKDLLMKYRKCFATTLEDVGRTTLLKHQIRLKPDARPVYRPGFKRFSQPELRFIEEEVRKQLEAGEGDRLPDA